MFNFKRISILLIMLLICFTLCEDKCDKETLTNDDKCTCKTDALSRYIIARKFVPIPKEREYYYSVLLFTGKNPFDLGNYYQCLRLPQVRYYTTYIKQVVDGKPQSIPIGLCIFQEC